MFAKFIEHPAIFHSIFFAIPCLFLSFLLFNRGPPVLAAITLPTEPQPLPKFNTMFLIGSFPDSFSFILNPDPIQLKVNKFFQWLDLNSLSLVYQLSHNAFSIPKHVMIVVKKFRVVLTQNAFWLQPNFVIYDRR